MDGREVVEILFAEFGFNEFLTRRIPPDVMGQLTKLMGIHETGLGRNMKVGRVLGALDGREYALGSGQTVRMSVTRPEDPRPPRRFQLVASTLAAHKLIDKAPAIEVAETGIYEVVLVESGYGWAVMCPTLLGCVSQGESEAEALENIQEAITGWLKGQAVDGERRKQEWLDEYRAGGFPVKTATVSVSRVTADAPIH